jgi:uncharacterized membrane protein
MESPFWHAVGMLKAVGLFLSGICHQLPEHSLLLAGTQMPFCARCTGTYLGASLALGHFWLRGRSRASRLPPPRILAVLGLFFALWAVDGVNSYWHFLSGNVLLYEPSNVLRLATGLVNGLALASLIFPLFNATLLQSPDQERSIANLRELGALLLQIAALGLVLLADVEVLLYPLLLADVLSVLLLLGMVNTMIVILLLRWENRAATWRQATLPLGLGLLLAVLEVGGIALFRAVLWERLL